MKDQASLDLRIVDLPLSSAALTGHLSIRATSTGLKVYDETGAEQALGQNSISVGPGLTGNGVTTALAINYSASHAFTGGFSVKTLTLGSKTVTDQNIVLLEGGTIPAAYIGSVSSRSAINLVLPTIKNGSTVHIQVEYTDDPTGATYTSLIDTLNGVGRTVTYAFNGVDAWSVCPVNGFDVGYAHQPVSIDLNGLLSTSTLHFLRYRFIDSVDGSISDWYGLSYPATTDTVNITDEMVELTVANTTNIVTIPYVQGGYRYVVTGTVKSLTLSSIENTSRESEVIFQAGAAYNQITKVTLTLIPDDNMIDNVVIVLNLYSGADTTSVYRYYTEDGALPGEAITTVFDIRLQFVDNVWVMTSKYLPWEFYSDGGYTSYWDYKNDPNPSVDPEDYWVTEEVCRSESSNLASTTFTSPNWQVLPIADSMFVLDTHTVTVTTTSANTSLNIPSTTGVIGEMPDFLPGYYILSFKNGIIAATEYIPGSVS